jgi:hypothetical protein
MSTPYLRLVPLPIKKGPFGDLEPRANLWRGKCITEGEFYGQWVYGDIQRVLETSIRNKEDQPDHKYIIHSGSETDGEYHMAAWAVDPTTVGQFINRLDRDSGAMLFEDDIIETDRSKEDDYCFLVVCEDNQFLFQPIVKGNWLAPLIGIEESAQDWDDIASRRHGNPTKIGNMHDNPELIGGKIKGE